VPTLRAPIPRVRLGVLELLVACTAAGGAVALMTTGGGMSDRLVSRVPLHSWVLAGLALLVVVGGSQLVGAMALLAKRPYARRASYAAGGVLSGWIVAQILILRTFQPVLQPTMFAVGCLIVVLTYRLPPEEPEPEPGRAGHEAEDGQPRPWRS
jgi:hypothetical protein